MQTILGPLIDVLTWVLDWLHAAGLTWGLSIIGLTIIVRLILFPLTWKQYKSAQQMQVIQPQIKELQKKYKKDRGKLQEETMKLYSEHRVNPFASCLPLVLQLPVFISLYAAIKGLGPLDMGNPPWLPSVEALNNASFLWIPHLGQSDPYYILLVLYVVSQMISTELMLATQSDKTQKMIMRAMPIMFVFFLFRFPAGLFVYWVTTNLWTIGQQLIIRRTMPKPEVMAAKAAAKPKKKSRFMEAMMASQGQAMKQREETIAKKKKSSGGSGTAGGKKPAGTAGAKKTASGRKPPPGKGKTKAKPGSSGKAKPGTTAGKSKPSSSAKPKPAASAGKSGSKQSGEGGTIKSPDGPAAG
jgi:YidC/Oxa1 family membrane protein insertase